MEIQGKIIAVLPIRQGVTRDGNPWASQEYVIETAEQFPKKCCFRVFGSEKIAQFDIRENDELKISVDINAREYQGKWFNDITCWKVEKSQTEAPQPVYHAPVEAAPLPQPDPSVKCDDLPF